MPSDGLAARLRAALAGSLPILAWLPGYDRAWLRPDVLAGVTVAAAVVPEALAYAKLANVGPAAGLYAALAAVLAYGVFGTSRQVVAGPTSALAILLATSVGSVAAGSPASYTALVTTTTVLVGVVGVAAWALRLGFLVNFVSGSVLTGFASGAGLYIASTQLGTLLGVTGSAGTFFERCWFVLTNLGATQPTTLAVGAGSVVALALGRRLLPRVPTALAVVLLAIAASATLDLQGRGVDVVGAVEGGLPPLTVPAVPDIGTVGSLVPVALALFLLSYVQGIGAVETFARRHGYDVGPNQELLAAGASNLAAGLVGGFAVGGSMSRSALNDAVGGRSQLVSGVVAVVLLVVLLFLTGLFTALPEATLAAVIVVAVAGLVDVAGLRRLWTVSRTEFAVAAAALGGVLALGMLWGVFLGVALSLGITVGRVTDPTTEVLARSPGTEHFVNRRRHPETVVDPGALVYRVDAELFYANARPVREDLLDRLEATDRPVDLVVFDLFSSPIVDLAAAEMLAALQETLADRGVDLRVAGANAQVERRLAAAAPDAFGHVNEEETIAAVIERWQQESRD